MKTGIQILLKEYNFDNKQVEQIQEQDGVIGLLLFACTIVASGHGLLNNLLPLILGCDLL